MTSAVVTLCSVLVLVFVVSWWSSRADDLQHEPAAESQRTATEPQRAEMGVPPDEEAAPEESDGESDENEP